MDELLKGFDTLKNQKNDNDEDDHRTSFAGFDFNISDEIWILDSEIKLNLKFVGKLDEIYREGIFW